MFLNIKRNTERFPRIHSVCLDCWVYDDPQSAGTGLWLVNLGHFPGSALWNTSVMLDRHLPKFPDSHAHTAITTLQRMHPLNDRRLWTLINKVSLASESWFYPAVGYRENSEHAESRLCWALMLVRLGVLSTLFYSYFKEI